MIQPKDVIEGIERGAAILRILGPLADELDRFITGDGPEPALFEQLPELRSPAALEKARYAARSNV